MMCRKCKTGWKDYAVSLFQYYPYRCKACGTRFFELRPKPPENAEKPTSTETEIRATRTAQEWKRKRREFLLYASALLCFVVFLYFVARSTGQAPDGN
jgi:hypothetical protein